jgi:hypothetical protein
MANAVNEEDPERDGDIQVWEEDEKEEGEEFLLTPITNDRR